MFVSGNPKFQHRQPRVAQSDMNNPILNNKDDLRSWVGRLVIVRKGVYKGKCLVYFVLY